MNQNTITISEIKRRGMAAIDDCLRFGPAHIIKRNKMTAVVLSQGEYQRLTKRQSSNLPGMTAVQWLLAQPSVGQRSKASIDTQLKTERSWRA